MEICTEIVGNLHDPEWTKRANELEIDYIPVDQWTAQKSRFLARGESGVEYPVALKRQTRVMDGDVVFYDPAAKKLAALRLELSPVLVIDLAALKNDEPEAIIRRAVELGHAIGNQHWPAVVKGAKVYVPLTVDKKVMLSVMETHKLEGVTFEFQPGREVIPYMAPHEIRRLFGGASHASHAHGEHTHGDHAHSHDHAHPHAHD